MYITRVVAGILGLGLMVLTPGCTSLPDETGRPASKIAEETLLEHASHGAIGAIGTASAFTELLARSQAVDNARADLNNAVELQIADLKQQLLRDTGDDKVNDAANFFKAVTSEMRRKVPVASRVLGTPSETIEGKVTSYAVVVLPPSLLLTYLDLDGAQYPTVYPLFQVTPGYRELTRQAQLYREYLASQP